MNDRLRTSVLFVLLLIFTPSSISSLISAKMISEPNVEIVSHTSFLAYGKMFTMVGEIENVGTVHIKNVTLTVTFYNLKGEVICTLTQRSIIEVLLTGRKSPFIFILANQTESAQVKTYQIKITSYEKEPEGKPEGLRISTPGIYNRTIKVIIQTLYPSIARFVIVTAIFYDQEKHVTATESFFISDLSYADTETTVEITFPYPDRWNITRWYSLTAESREFAIREEINFEPILEQEPENQSFDSIMVLFVSLIVISAITLLVALLIAKRKKKRRSRRIKRATQ